MPPQTRMGRYRGMCALSLLLCGLVAPAMAQVFVYDDFSGTLLDPARWRPQLENAGNIYEMRRQISGGELIKALVVNGEHKGGGAAFGRHELHFVRTDFTALQFEATMLTAAVTGCATPGSRTSWIAVYAHLTLFNDGSSTAQDDQRGDIVTRLEIVRASDTTDPPEGLQAVSQLTRCANPTCTVREFIGVASLGPVILGERNTYAVDWDASSQRVVFWKNADPPQTIPYPHTVSSRRSRRALALAGSAAHCVVDPRPVALVHTSIDNVTVRVP